MPPITYCINDMPAFSAAFGSFHVKSSSTSFVYSLMTARGLPFFLTITFLCSTTLTVSSLSVRWYTDQRYWSMQTSATGHSSRVSVELTGSLTSVYTGSGLLTAAICVGGVSGTRMSGVLAVAICTRGVSGASEGSGNTASTIASASPDPFVPVTAAAAVTASALDTPAL